MFTIYVRSVIAQHMGVEYGVYFDLSLYPDQELLEDDIGESVTMFEYEIAKIVIQDTGLRIAPETNLDAIYQAIDIIAADDDRSCGFLAYLDYQCGNLEQALESFDDAYRGLWKSLEDYAHEFLMDVDEDYRAAIESFRGWSPQIDQIAFQCDYATVQAIEGVHIFSKD